MFLPEDETTATLGVDQRVKMIERQGKRWRLAIWDTAGQERFRTLTSSYYRSCVAVAVVYDLTNRTSFEALPSWFAELDTFAGPEVVRVVVANKADQEPARAVTNAEGRTFAESKGATFVEVSAKQGRGVDELFESMVDRVRLPLACGDSADERDRFSPTLNYWRPLAEGCQSPAAIPARSSWTTPPTRQAGAAAADTSLRPPCRCRGGHPPLIAARRPRSIPSHRVLYRIPSPAPLCHPGRASNATREVPRSDPPTSSGVS